MMSDIPIPAALLILLATSLAHAQNQHSQELEADSETGVSQSVHSHGKATLFIVAEGEQLYIELHSPAINLLGFEHHAQNPEQLANVESAKSALANADSLFQIHSATCHLTDQQLDFSHVSEEHDDHSTAENHSDIKAHYRYRCEQLNQVYSLSTTLADHFPAIESLQVQWVANGQQGAITLDNNLRQLNFR